jgi:hypothetical protein
MTISDAASIAALVVDLVALYFLIKIFKDDRVMRVTAEESLQVQKDYLGLRRRWYEQRSKKGVLAKIAGGVADTTPPSLIGEKDDNQL